MKLERWKCVVQNVEWWSWKNEILWFEKDEWLKRWSSVINKNRIMKFKSWNGVFQKNSIDEIENAMLCG